MNQCADFPQISLNTTNITKDFTSNLTSIFGSDSNLLIVFYVQIMPDDLVMQLHRF